MKNKSKVSLAVFCLILFIASLLFIYDIVSTLLKNKTNKAVPKEQEEEFNFPKDLFDTEDKKESGVINIVKKTFKIKENDKEHTSPYIAVLYIEGVIQEENDTYSQKFILKTIDRLLQDSYNKGLILYINSPGGTVYQADEAYLALKKYAATGRPLYSYLAEMATSGGYYIACSTNKLYANRNTLTGSIGVIASSSYDLTSMLEKLGIKATTIYSGKNKNMLNFNEPLTEEQKKIMQDISEECYNQFVEIVASARNLPINAVKTLADGRIYTARQALDNGLIDGIKDLDETIKAVKEECGEKNLKVFPYHYERELGIKDLLFSKTHSNLSTFLSRVINGYALKYPAFIAR